MLLKIIVSATLCEAIVETLKMTRDKEKISFSRVLALFFGILIALVCQLDILTSVGLPVRIPVFGNIFTGILISRGANFVSDFIKMIGGIKE